MEKSSIRYLRLVYLFNGSRPFIFLLLHHLLRESIQPSQNIFSRYSADKAYLKKDCLYYDSYNQCIDSTLSVDILSTLRLSLSAPKRFSGLYYSLNYVIYKVTNIVTRLRKNE